jgi:hypothetical protein
LFPISFGAWWLAGSSRVGAARHAGTASGQLPESAGRVPEECWSSVTSKTGALGGKIPVRNSTRPSHQPQKDIMRQDLYLSMQRPSAHSPPKFNLRRKRQAAPVATVPGCHQDRACGATLPFWTDVTGWLSPSLGQRPKQDQWLLLLDVKRSTSSSILRTCFRSRSSIPITV